MRRSHGGRGSVLERQIAAVVGRRPQSRRGAALARRRGSSHHWGPSRVQSLLFDVDRWSSREAVQWARSHGFRADKVHVTDHYVRLRQFVPTPGWPKRVKRFGQEGRRGALGISAVVEFSPI